MRSSKPFLLLCALVSALGLSAVLGYMIYDRAAILRDGQTIVLKSLPVDPRDLLRGAYVRLNYDISTVPLDLFPSEEQVVDAQWHPVFVRLEPGADGLWVATAAVTGQRPVGDKTSEVWIRGIARYGGGLTDGGKAIEVDYGIERFYAQEKVAPEIEANTRARELTEIVVAVADDGRAQIKALRQGGQTIYTEQLF